MARRATLIRQARARTKGALLVVDAGDVFTRGPWHRVWYGAPEIAAMNLMGYDLLCVGNNEFKATPDVTAQEKMRTLVGSSRFPWVAANLTVAATGKPVPGIKPFVVRTFGKMRVGLLGLISTAAAGYPQIAGWQVGDPVEAARRWVPIVRKQCDVLIAVVHLGHAEECRLAEQVAGIDVVVGGHSHTFTPQPAWVRNPKGVAVPVVQGGEQGVVLGKLALTFEYAKGWRLKAAREDLVPVTEAVAQEAGVKKMLAKYGIPDPKSQIQEGRGAEGTK